MDDKKIVSFLLDKGINPANLGFRYLKDAVSICINDLDKLKILTGPAGLYKEVAELNNTTPSRVERAIRHSIERALDKGGYRKMTNGEFIASSTYELRDESEDETLKTCSDVSTVVIMLEDAFCCLVKNEIEEAKNKLFDCIKTVKLYSQNSQKER